MGFLRRWWWLLVLVILIGVLAWCRSRGQDDTTGADTSPTDRTASTNLEIEMYGGFAYIRSTQDNSLEIAYLKDWEETSTGVASAAKGELCDVDQLGVDLMVISGTIVDTVDPPATKMFDLAGTVVTFPDLAGSEKPLTADRTPRPTAAPFGPGDPSNPAQWYDLKWVPRLNAEYPSNPLNPDWRNLVDGRIVVKGGTFSALHPSDVVARDSIFEFRSKSGPAPFKQAATDRTVYKTEVPAAQIVIDLSKAGADPKRITVKPVSPGRPVRLKVMGRHTMGAMAELKLGSEIKDYCGFYQLMQPIPAPSQRLKVFYVEGPKTPAEVAGVAPTPGPYCIGSEWP